MSKSIQIRNVPDGLHKKLETRTAMHDKSLSDYLLGELNRIASLPTREEMVARLHSRKPVKLRIPAAKVIRRGRDSA